MSHRLTDLAGEFGVLVTELLVLLVVVTALLGLTARRMGVARLQDWLGGGRIRGALKGTLLGLLTPFCTYTAIPVFAGMISARVRTATLASFLLGSPLTDPVIIVALVPLFGWKVAAVYTVTTSVCVFLIAIAADAAHLERHLRPPRSRTLVRTEVRPQHAIDAREYCDTDCAIRPDPFTNPDAWGGLRIEGRTALRYALSQGRALVLPMIAAAAVAVALLGFTPQDLIARWAGPDNPLAIPAAALLGAPFYVSTEAFLPIAATLHSNGMGLGAVIALTVSAAGVNVPELALLSRMMTPRLLASYTLAILTVAIITGYLIPK
jgi:uncharacterized membrane protein YraQ (UPF0718 family)